jgi:non-ribosomal peptide synthase protein (TIGR01720 family)
VHPLAVTVDEDDLGPWLMALKEAYAAVSQRGREFYALRYGSQDAAVREAFANYRQPEVLFNFSGLVQRSHAHWRSVQLPAIEMGDGNANPYALSVETEIREGELLIRGYSRPELWSADATDRLAQALADALRQIIRHCVDAAHRRWTPSDFPQLSLTQSQADELPLSCRTAYPLTDMQQTMWRHKQTYQVVMCYRMPRRFDERHWTGAVADWIGRHDCLRTYVKEWSVAEACQVVLDTLAPPLTMHRVTPGAGRELAARLVEQERRAPVQLDRAPLFHLHAIDEGGEDFLVVLAIHHLIHDGWSIERLLGDLLQTYRHEAGEGCARPDTPLASVADIVAQQQALSSSEKWRDYWQGLPWEATACQLPSATSSSQEGSLAQRDVRLHLGTIDPQLAVSVRATAAQWGVTVNSLWLAGYATLLRYLGGQPQVRCGVIQSGRSEDIVGVETLTGCCVNTLPLVLNIAPEHTPGDIVAAVNGQLAACAKLRLPCRRSARW